MSGLKIKKDQPVHNKAMIAAERMMFNADKSELVSDGDPRAATLAVPYGRRIHPDMVKQFAIKDGKLAKAGSDKARKGTKDKGK